MSLPRPRPDQRATDAFKRLRHNPDFVAFHKLMEDELAYYTARLVNEDDTGFALTQGRCRELQDLLDHIHKED